MAEEREPPPFQNEPELFGDDDDDDDIFKSAVGPPKMEVDPEPVALLDPEPMEKKESEPEPSSVGPAVIDPVSSPKEEEAVATLDLRSPDEPPHADEPPTLNAADMGGTAGGDANVGAASGGGVSEDGAAEGGADDDDGEDLFASPSADLPVKKESVPDEPEADEQDDTFNIEITVNNPMKVGDGMNAYMVYQVNTVTNIPAFQKSQFAVKRRFSDFLGLHDKLVNKHRANGIIVPKPPEKSTMGMAKVKMSKEESSPLDFVEKRRAALERFMNRTVAHPTLRMDPDVRDYLTLDADLPKSSGTSALSAAGVMRLFGKVGEAVTKLSSSMTEKDSWFEEKIHQIESLEAQLRKLHESSEALVARRQHASQNTTQLAKALAVVATCDEHTTLSQVMSKLSQLEDTMQQITEEQTDSDFFTLSELLKDYLSQISAVKDVFAERVKIHKAWKDAEMTLTKKREAKVKIELAHKTDKLLQAQQECEEWEEKVKKGESDFKKISDALKREMAGFDKKRCKDFKANLVNYLEKLLNNEEQLIKHWEGFLPEARSIA